MVTRLGEERDTKQLKALWLETFSDSKEFVDWNFEKNYSPENVVLAEESGEVLSALHIIEYPLIFEDSLFRGAYISAVATKKAFRKRGLGSAVLKKAEEVCINRGFDICFLVPDVSGFYEKFGYSYAAKEEFKTFSSKDFSGEYKEPKNLSAEEFFKLYGEIQKGRRFYLKRERADSDMIFEDFIINTKGVAQAIPNEGYILFKDEGEKIFVSEILAKSEEAKNSLLSCADSFNKPVEAKLPPIMIKIISKNPKLSKLKKETAIGSLSREEIYFNLML